MQQTATSAISPTRTNWAGNYTYRAPYFAEPTSLGDLRAVVSNGKHAKAVGTRHSFNHIADTDDTQVASTHLKTIELDIETRTVTLGAGVTYGELAPILEAHGFALPNLASLPHISVVGACSTATHGSGLNNGCLATSVIAVELLTASNDLLLLARDTHPEIFPYAVTSLGALGVITRLTLALVPAFQVAQTVYENLCFTHLENNLRDIFGAAYSVSLFTDWQRNRATQAWLKHKLKANELHATPESFFGATRQTRKLHPLPDLSAENCTEQEGIPGPWYERLPHFRLDYTPSAGAEIQTEYFVALDEGYAAIRAVETLRDQITPHLLITELRTVAADNLPLSMCSGRQGLGIHFTWKQDLEAVRAVLPLIEEQLKPFAARPHWAKLFTMPMAQVRALYPGFSRFQHLTRDLDPGRKFRNEFLNELLD